MQNKAYLRELREENNLTQQEVAEKIGVTKATISKYEKGLRKINHIEELAELYNVDPTYILTGKSREEWEQAFEKTRAIAEAEERLYWENTLREEYSVTTRALLDLLNSMNNEGQQKVLEYAEDLVTNPKYQIASSDKNDE